MAILDPINIGAFPDDGTGDPLRTAFNKSNQNDQAINDDVGQNTNDITDLQNDKADRANPSTAGNIAELDAGGNVVDSGSAVSDVLINPVTNVDFDPQSTPPLHLEGRVYYDDTKKALSYYNDETEITINLAQEFIIPIRNETGSTITNGQVVYPAGGSSGKILVDLALAQDKDRSRLVAMATHAIENNSNGYITRLGAVGGLDTSSFSAGEIVYLSSTTPGAVTNVKPDDGAYIIPVGVVEVSDAANGIIVIDPTIAELTVEVTDTNGFPPEQRAATTISFVNGTRTFTIAPTGSDFHYYMIGDKFEKTSSDSVVITDVDGGHIVYYDGETLTVLANPTFAQASELIRTKCLVAYLYWNSTEAELQILNDERHGISMSPETHAYLHFTRGIQYLSGLAIENIVIGNGSLDSHAQFGTALGFITDEDLLTSLDAVANTTGLKYFYREGASGVYNSGTNAGFSFPIGATPLPQYNEFTGSTYQLTEIASGNYMLLHIFATNDINDEPICVLGNSEYSTISAATIGAESEIGTILGQVPVPEFLPIATIIIEGKTSFTNSVQTRVVQTSNGEDYIDWRTSELQPGASPTDHNNLANLQLAGNTITWGHIDDQPQTIYGRKTFDSQVIPGNNTVAFSATPNFDFDNGNVQQITLTGNITSWTISNQLAAGSYTIFFIQDATGGRTIADPTGPTETDNSIADFITSANAVNIVNIFVTPGGTSYWSLVETITP